MLLTSFSACIYRPIPDSDEDLEIEVTVEGSYVPFVPAKTYGPPEDCYPAEGGYCDDVFAYVDLPPLPGSKKARRGYVSLTEDEVEQFSSQLSEVAMEDSRDYDDDDYDVNDHDYFDDRV
jgi:hypothetical protein